MAYLQPSADEQSQKDGQYFERVLMRSLDAIERVCVLIREPWAVFLAGVHLGVSDSIPEAGATGQLGIGHAPSQRIGSCIYSVDGLECANGGLIAGLALASSVNMLITSTNSCTADPRRESRSPLSSSASDRQGHKDIVDKEGRDDDCHDELEVGWNGISRDIGHTCCPGGMRRLKR